MARILVIDDEELVRESLKKILERAGYDVVAASDGDSGEALFRQSPMDLVIIDILMPQKNGIETIVSLLRDYPQVKIIAISGGGKTGQLNFLPAAQHLGAVRTFVKPFNPHELVESIKEELGE